MGMLIILKETKPLAEDEIGEERPEGSLVGVGPEGEEKQYADEGPGPEERLKIVDLEHGLDDGDRRDWERGFSVTVEERVECIGGRQVDVGSSDGDMLVAVQKEAKASANDVAHAHVKRVGVGWQAGRMRM